MKGWVARAEGDDVVSVAPAASASVRALPLVATRTSRAAAEAVAGAIPFWLVSRRMPSPAAVLRDIEHVARRLADQVRLDDGRVDPVEMSAVEPLDRGGDVHG